MIDHLPEYPPDGRNPFIALNYVWQQISRADKAFHTYIGAHFPKTLAIVDQILAVIVDEILANPLFSVILALLMIVLGIAGVDRVVLVSIVGAWAVAFLWIARSDSVGKLTIPTRLVVLMFAGVVLAAIGREFGKWALLQYHQHATQEAKQKLDSSPAPGKKLPLQPRSTVKPSTPKPSALGIIQAFFRSRTIVYVDAYWNDLSGNQGQWEFWVDHMGDTLSANNIEIVVADLREGLFSSRTKTVVSGLNINPEPGGTTHRMHPFLLPSLVPNDERFLFQISDSRESAIQEIWLQKGHGRRMFAPWAVASRVIDARTHKTMLACKDEEVTDLNKSWDQLRAWNNDSLVACEPVGMFRLEAVLPEIQDIQRYKN